MKKILIALVLLVPFHVNAATISCDAEGDRGADDNQFMLLTPNSGATGVSCFETGQGNDPYENLVGKWNFETSAITGTNPFNFVAGAGVEWAFEIYSFLGLGPDAIIVFEFGSGSPDWFAYTIGTMLGGQSSLNCVGVDQCLNGVSLLGLGVYSDGARSDGTMVPEPTTLALLGLGLVGMGMRRRIKAS